MARRPFEANQEDAPREGVSFNLTMRSLLSYCLLSALATFVLNIAWQKWWLREVFVDPSAIISQALRITSRSWELGTLTQALLELEAPELTVFASNPFPEGQIPPVVQPDNVRALKYARSNIWTNHSHLLFNGEGEHDSYFLMLVTSNQSVCSQT